MRRKSERTASKKGKASPEKKIEKPKKSRTRRRKHSSSSENESAEEAAPVSEVETISVATEKQPPEIASKEENPEEAQNQVWSVKTSGGSGDVGELKKLKICLTRPPSTPERVDRSPRSKRKHSRAASSSDTPSVESTDEKKKSKHRSRRATRDLKEELDREDSQSEEPETDVGAQKEHDTSNEVTQSEQSAHSIELEETPMSTTNEEAKVDESKSVAVKKTSESNSQSENKQEEKISDADTTVASPKDERQLASSPEQAVTESNSDQTQVDKSDTPVQKDTEMVDEDKAEEKSEILEIHAEESKCESDNEAHPSKEAPKEDVTTPQEEKATAEQVSINEENISKESKETDSNNKDINITNVVESSDNDVKKRNARKSVDNGEKTPEIISVPEKDEPKKQAKELKRTDSVVSTNSTAEEVVANGQAAPIVRKRKWGTRSKVTTQTSITISTDILKEIIPDVKPVEFEEVIEEKKHRKERRVSEKIERPVLPKIIIDNNLEPKLDSEEKTKEVSKPRDLATNRKISIIKDNDSILDRPPSPPRNKQSCILYITNLVRPFTLPQLKNLLQRTGRIVENGFWIDRIKSKCFVQYESEDQAIETRHALHGVTWPVSNPKTLQVDFSTEEAFEKAKSNEEAESAPVSTIPGTVEDWLREQDLKRERGELDKPWERKTREWDLGKNEKDKDKDKLRRDERPLDKRRHRSPEKSPEPARKFKKKEEEAPAKLLDDLFRKTKTTPCIYWLPLSAETIAVKEEQRRQHMADHERRLQELRRTHRRH